jgi:hypothetical protein
MNAMFPIKLFLLVWLIVVLAIASIAAKEKTTMPAELKVTQHSESDGAGHQVESTGISWSRFREGSKVTDELGEFQMTADRFNFHLQSDKRSIRVLENLSLERVARTLEDDPSPRMWSVSGVVTEFRGENYLLITRAVLKPRQAPASRKPVAKKALEGESSPDPK